MALYWSQFFANLNITFVWSQPSNNKVSLNAIFSSDKLLPLNNSSGETPGLPILNKYSIL